MSKQRDTDKAIRNLMKWLEQPEFQERHATVIEEHMAPVCKHLGISQEELFEEIIENGLDGMLFGIMFEDFISSPFLPDNRTMVDDYLKRRGWRESVQGRRYLQKLSQSTLSLYEIVEISPGQHCDVRDVIRGGDTVRVFEKMGTQNLVKWDRLAARILNNNGKHIFSGGMLPFRQEAAQSLLRVIDNTRKEYRKAIDKLKDKQVKDLSSINHEEDILQDSCYVFTSTWLIHTLDGLHQAQPEMQNFDGEAIEFTETRFTCLDEQVQTIIDRLDSTIDWERDTTEALLWNWFPPQQQNNKKTGNTKKGMSIGTLDADQRQISGMLELSPDVLKLTTNSRERAQRGKDELESLLDGLIGPPLSTIQTPEQALSESEAERDNGSDINAMDDIDTEVAAKMVEDYLDQHYRDCLDETIPMLGDKTPRQCASSKKDQAKVIEWLKHLENNEHRRVASQGGKPYDSGWIWEELNLEKYRH